jgi:hypothetical protein
MVTYNIPETLMAQYRGNPVVIRTQDPGALVSMLRQEDLEWVHCIQLRDIACDLRPLIDGKCSGPVEVLLENPGVQFSELYRLTELLRACPVRISIPVEPGFLKAVRVAASLHCAVKLDLGQPTPGLVDELLEALDFYLHGNGVTEPMEFFHSLLGACCHGAAITLWDIQEEHPAHYRHVSDDGGEALQGRLSGLDAAQCDSGRLSAHPECAACPYAAPCAGYFKWPRPGYDCVYVKRVFAKINEAAQTLAEHLNERSGPDGPAAS